MESGISMEVIKVSGVGSSGHPDFISTHCMHLLGYQHVLYKDIKQGWQDDSARKLLAAKSEIPSTHMVKEET